MLQCCRDIAVFHKSTQPNQMSMRIEKIFLNISAIDSFPIMQSVSVMATSVNIKDLRQARGEQIKKQTDK